MFPAMSGANGDGGRLRLSPEMASLRLLVLKFVRDYWDQWGDSPSYGEIAAAIGRSRKTVKHCVISLAADGLLIRTPGPRGLSLPDATQEALQLLRKQGWAVAGPHSPLLPPDTLDYVPRTASRSRRG